MTTYTQALTPDCSSIVSGVIQYPDQSPNPITVLTLSSGYMMGVTTSYSPICPTGKVVQPPYSTFVLNLRTSMYSMTHFISYMIVMHIWSIDLCSMRSYHYTVKFHTMTDI